MAKVLVLTAGYGEGHNAAARGLQAAFEELGESSEIVDLFAIAGGRTYEPSRRGYLELINHAPSIWAAAYSAIDRFPIVELTLPLMGAMERALGELLANKAPLAVLSVYPIYAFLIDRLFPNAAERPFRFHTVVTDSITINSVWHRRTSDTFFVANVDTADVMRAAGVPAEKLQNLGFPVVPRFSRDRPVRPVPSAGVAPRVLYMINAGRAQAAGIVRGLLALPHIELTVTVGRDEALGTELQQIAHELLRPLAVHGWTPHMPELVMSHHVLIGKAGGATVQEAIAACTPMLLTQVIPGQEEGNAQLLLTNECGALCSTPAALAEMIERLFVNDAALWERWEGNIRALSKPGAARAIAQFVLEEAGGSRAAAA